MCMSGDKPSDALGDSRVMKMPESVQRVSLTSLVGAAENSIQSLEGCIQNRLVRRIEVVVGVVTPVSTPETAKKHVPPHVEGVFHDLCLVSGDEVEIWDSHRPDASEAFFERNGIVPKAGLQLEIPNTEHPPEPLIQRLQRVAPISAKRVHIISRCVTIRRGCAGCTHSTSAQNLPVKDSPAASRGRSKKNRSQDSKSSSERSRSAIGVIGQGA